MESDGLHAVHLFEDNPSTASWVAQSLSSVADRIKAASHVLPAEVQTVLQDGVDGPAVIIQESTAGGDYAQRMRMRRLQLLTLY